MSQGSESSLPVGTVDDENIYISELITEYTKTGNSEPELAGLKSFLPLYLNYKAKLAFGYDEGYFRDSLLIKEYNTYVNEAAYSYLQNNVVKPELFEEFSKRSNWELKVFHVLITTNDLNDQSELESINIRLEKARQDLKNGVSYEEVNYKYSSVMQGRRTGGTLPWITAGTTVKPFEDVVYGLNTGEISKVFQTQFGYHLTVLLDRRAKTPARSVSHIYTRRQSDSAFIQKIETAHRALADSGRTWSYVVKNYSEDPASVARNGNVGWIDYTSNLPKEFLNKVMNLDPSLPYSEPIETQFGFHIFKIDSVRTFNSPDEKKEYLQERFENASYNFQNKDLILKRLKQMFPDENINNANVVDKTISLYPEFGEIARSYLEGLVIFKINEHYLWSANSSDSLAVRKIYSKYKEQFRIEPRPYYYKYTSSDPSSLKDVISFIERGNEPSAVADNFKNIQVISDSSTSYENISDFELRSIKAETFSPIKSLNNRNFVIWLQDHLEERIMTFGEAFNQVFNEYLPIKEKQFIEDLREAYKVNEIYPNLEQAYNSYKFRYED
ncbi:MAG: peptidylprolyl isomerase [Gracilimonas sp.]|nr:peptidylprolyl isomerase [Gracilimonas sp.]